MSININNEITVLLILYQEENSQVLQNLEKIKNFKIIIIDNSNNIELQNIIKNKYNIYKYIVNKENIGFAKAANIGINLVNTKYIIFSQGDCPLSEENIFSLFEAYKKYNDCFLISPTFINENMEISYNAGPFPEKKIDNETIHLEGDICAEGISTAIILFKKEDILNIGLFNENFFIYFMDYDLCRRIRNIKKSVIQTNDVKIKHVHGNLKVRNIYKKIFSRNYNFSYDELIYFYNINKYESKFNKLKKKLPKYIFKAIINLFFFKFSKSVYYFALICAYYNFNKFLKKNSQ